MARSVTLTPKTFATEWAKQFEKVVRQAAGKDGRVSVSEARRIAERVDGGQLFSDNAVNTLLGKNQKTISVDKLVEAGKGYALTKATEVAGKDGKLSKADAARLPLDLRDDFTLVKAGGITEDSRTPAQLKADVHDFAMRVWDGASATKLTAAPPEVRGLRPTEANVPHDPTGTSFSTYVAKGQVYLQVAAQNPSPLVGWYRAGPVPPANTGRAELRTAIDNATVNLLTPSESDAPLLFVSSPDIGNAPVTEQLVRERFGATHDRLFPKMFGWDNTTMDLLAARTAEPIADGDQWLERLATDFDPNDPASIERGARFANLRDVMRANLTDLKVLRFGTTDKSVFVVGRSKNGDLAGVFTGQVET